MPEGYLIDGAAAFFPLQKKGVGEGWRGSKGKKAVFKKQTPCLYLLQRGLRHF